jgi:hypothetical protein
MAGALDGVRVVESEVGWAATCLMPILLRLSELFVLLPSPAVTVL